MNSPGMDRASRSCWCLIFRIKSEALFFLLQGDGNDLALWVTLARLLLSDTQCHMTHRGHKGSLGCHDDAARDAERKKGKKGGRREPERQRYAKGSTCE